MSDSHQARIDGAGTKWKHEIKLLAKTYKIKLGDLTQKAKDLAGSLKITSRDSNIVALQMMKHKEKEPTPYLIQYDQQPLRSDKCEEALTVAPCITPGGRWMIVPWMRPLGPRGFETLHNIFSYSVFHPHVAPPTCLWTRWRDIQQRLCERAEILSS